jgi:hypothetical protein
MCVDRKRDYMKENLNSLATNSKNKKIRYLYRVINEFKRHYQSRNNFMKYEASHLLADSHNIVVGGIITFLSY